MEEKRKEEGFRCKWCGRCCLATDHVNISMEDIELWKRVGREDLFTPEMIAEWDYFGASSLFRNQNSFRCPFLRKKKNSNPFIAKFIILNQYFVSYFLKIKNMPKSSVSVWVMKLVNFIYFQYRNEVENTTIKYLIND